MPDRDDVALGSPDAERAIADVLDLVVHPFERAVGGAQRRLLQDPVEMRGDHSCEVLERFEPAVTCPPEPLLRIEGRGANQPAQAYKALRETSAQSGYGQLDSAIGRVAPAELVP